MTVKLKKLNMNELEKVNGAGSENGSFVHIYEPTPGDPRCRKCNSHLNYTHTFNNVHYFVCSGCGKSYRKTLCGVWFEN